MKLKFNSKTTENAILIDELNQLRRCRQFHPDFIRCCSVQFAHEPIAASPRSRIPWALTTCAHRLV
jgi:hypothetical protein